MRTKEGIQTITFTSPTTAITAIGGTFKSGLLRNADSILVEATIAGAVGGVLDIYLQRKVADDTWTDWVHFTQVAAAASAVKFNACITSGPQVPVLVGGGNDATPAPALAANTMVNTLPGGDVRIVAVAGVLTTAGASQTVSLTYYTDQH